MTRSPEITLAPIPYHWRPEERRDFYARIADEAPVGTVYLGEVICSKRTPFFEGELPDIADRLERGGKRVVWSSLCEVVLKRERKMTEALAACSDGREVEANNTAVLAALGGRFHRIGPMMNVYNEATLGWLADRGARHVCLPVELPGRSVAAMAAAARALGVGCEVQVFGRAALAVSARCYHARAHRRTKDDCRFVCEENRDGLALETLDGQSFLRINGIQTLSEGYVALPGEVPAMAEMGVTALRLVPECVDMIAAARVFDDLARGACEGAEAEARLAAIAGTAPLSNGFWHARPGRERVSDAA